jgi:hypothetical protein
MGSDSMPVTRTPINGVAADRRAETRYGERTRPFEQFGSAAELVRHVWSSASPEATHRSGNCSSAASSAWKFLAFAPGKMLLACRMADRPDVSGDGGDVGI